MSITNYLNKIKTAVYGRDVRGAIHDAIKECYDDASVNHDNANMEVKMARGTHNTLNDRLDKSDEIQAQTNAQLSSISNVKVLFNIDGTNYTVGDLVDCELIRNKQMTNLGNFFKKLKKNNEVKICCIGDSLTYGHDVTSVDKRPADTNLCDDGSSHTNTRASVTYPEALRKFLSSIYNDNIIILNHGYSGDWVEQGVKRWCKKHDSDVTIAMFGTNDCRASWVTPTTRGNIEEYVKWYEQLVIREVLWGKGVILMTPPKLPSSNDQDVDTYAQVVKYIGIKYGVPVLDSETFTANYSADIYSDEVHFNGKGYSIFASRVASALINGNLNSPKAVNGSTSLTLRQTLDNVTVKGNAYITTSTGSITVDEWEKGKGYLGVIEPTGGRISFSFYCECENLCVLPIGTALAGFKGKIMLDFGVEQGKLTHQYVIDGSGLREVIPNQFDLSYSVRAGNFISKSYLEDNPSVKPLMITTKGWHTLTIEGSGASYYLNAIEFANYEDINIRQLFKQRKGYFDFFTHKNHTDTDNVTTTKISLIEMANALGLNLDYNAYWKGYPLTLKIYNWDYSIIEYKFSIGDAFNSGECGYLIAKSTNKYNLVDNPSSSFERTLNNISYSHQTQEITLEWGGATTRASHIVISI